MPPRACQQQTLEAAGFTSAVPSRPAAPASQPTGPWKRVAKSVAVLSNMDRAQQEAYRRSAPASRSPERGKEPFVHKAMRLLPPPLTKPVAHAPPARSDAEIWARALNQPTLDSDKPSSPVAWARAPADTCAPKRSAPSDELSRHTKRPRGASSQGTASPRRAVPSAPAFSAKARAEVRQLTSRAGLMDKKNAITHSDVHARSQLYTAANRGHQENATGKDSMPVSRNFWLQARATKLKAQAEGATSDLFKGVRAYITGYTEGTTHRELARIIHAHGGQVELHANKHVTHTVSSMALSGSKMHAAQTGQGRGAQTVGHLVLPAWVLDSAAQAVRLAERRYAVHRTAVAAAGPKPAAPHSSALPQTSLRAFLGGSGQADS